MAKESGEAGVIPASAASASPEPRMRRTRTRFARRPVDMMMSCPANAVQAVGVFNQ